MSRASDVFSIPAIIRNDRGMYEGNLRHYVKVLFFNAQNIRHPYHNLRHMLHVTYLCYLAIVYYGNKMTPREARNLLIAALFHDFDHSGLSGNDDRNLARAARALQKYAAPVDWPHLGNIKTLMWTTEFPHKVHAEQLDLLGEIWLQQVVVGLSQEMGKTPMDLLKMQRGFHEHLKYQTEWARDLFPPEVVSAKIAEAEEYLDILESEDDK